MFVCDNTSEEDDQNRNMFGKISAQPHPTLCIQFLDRKNQWQKQYIAIGKTDLFYSMALCGNFTHHLSDYTEIDLIVRTEICLSKYVWAMT